MFCCLFRKREQTKELNIEQINVLVSIDRESELTRNSSVYYNSSLYFKDTTIDEISLGSDECIVYELLQTIINTIIDNGITN